MVDGKKWMGESDVTVNNVQFFEDPRTVTTINAVVNIRVYASSQSDQTGQPVLANTPVKVVGWCHGEKVGDEDRWWITEYSHSRMWVGGTVEKPEDRVVVEEPQPDTDGSFVNVNGQIYYPVNEEIREVEVKNDAVLYKYATFGSEKVGEVKKGDVIKVAYWCLGDEQAEEEVWWILDDPQGRNDISYGARVHATDTMDRPE
jgi:ribosomal protein S16